MNQERMLVTPSLPISSLSAIKTKADRFGFRTSNMAFIVVKAADEMLQGLNQVAQ